MLATEFDKRTYSSDCEYMIQNLKEKSNLEKWQKLLCQAVNVFAYFVDCDGTPLTALSGNPDEAARLMKAVDQEQLQNMLTRVCESTLEDQAIEETGYSNLRMAVITARAFGRPILNWVIFGVLSDVSGEEDGEKPELSGYGSTISARAFNRVIDAVSEFSRDIVSSAAHTLNAEAESRRSQYSAKALEANLKRTEALAEIIQLLENDDTIEKMMLRILKTVGSFLNLSTASLCKKAKQPEEIDILSYWCNQKEVWCFESGTGQKRPFFFKEDKKPYILSDCSGLKKEERKELEELRIRAIVVIPVEILGKVDMYAAFTEKRENRIWQKEEVKFLSDAMKILQSILTRRIQKNSLAGSYACLETILDNVGGCCVCQGL